MAPRTGTRQTTVPNRLAFVQRTERGLKRRVDDIAQERGISTNALINELLEQLVEADEHERVAA
jgi:predicted HicB family RNase H-like nuclease